MFSFMDFGEIGRLKKFKTIKQVSNVYQFPIHKYYNKLKNKAQTNRKKQTERVRNKPYYDLN